MQTGQFNQFLHFLSHHLNPYFNLDTIPKKHLVLNFQTLFKNHSLPHPTLNITIFCNIILKTLHSHLLSNKLSNKTKTHTLPTPHFIKLLYNLFYLENIFIFIYLVIEGLESLISGSGFYIFIYFIIFLDRWKWKRLRFFEWKWGREWFWKGDQKVKSDLKKWAILILI